LYRLLLLLLFFLDFLERFIFRLDPPRRRPGMAVETGLGTADSYWEISFPPVHKLAGKMGLSKLERGIAPLADIYIIQLEIYNIKKKRD